MNINPVLLLYMYAYTENNIVVIAHKRQVMKAMSVIWITQKRQTRHYSEGLTYNHEVEYLDSKLLSGSESTCLFRYNTIQTYFLKFVLDTFYCDSSTKQSFLLTDTDTFCEALINDQFNLCNFVNKIKLRCAQIVLGLTSYMQRAKWNPSIQTFAA